MTGSYDNKLYVFNLATGRVIEQISAHTDAVSACLTFNELNFVVSGSWDNHLKIWDLRDLNSPCEIFEDHEDRISGICKDTSGVRPNLIISADILGRIVIRDIRQGVLEVLDTVSQINDIKYSLKDNRILSANSDSFRIYEFQGKLHDTLDIPNISCFDTDGTFILCALEDSGLELWNLDQNQKISSWANITKPSAINVSHHGETVIIGNEDGVIYNFR